MRMGINLLNDAHSFLIPNAFKCYQPWLKKQIIGDQLVTLVFQIFSYCSNSSVYIFSVKLLERIVLRANFKTKNFSSYLIIKVAI